jgi:hypothetical protein
MRTTLILSAILATCLALYAIYAVIFFNWVVVTPLTDAELKRAEYELYGWFVIFVAASSGSIALTVLSIVRGRRRKGHE